jgi:hypothetical protein
MARRLDGLGPLFGSDPAIQLCLLAARRQLGQFQEAADWCRRFQLGNAAPAWRSAAAAELWLLDHQGPPPRPVMICWLSPNRPFLDGNFDDPCWEGLHPVVLQNAVGDTVKDYHTEARLAFDEEFLYIAVRCAHPAGGRVPPAKVRKRDADLRAFDRVSILLDLDRDYSTCFHLQVDQRGCVREDCWESALVRGGTQQREGLAGGGGHPPGGADRAEGGAEHSLGVQRGAGAAGAGRAGLVLAGRRGTAARGDGATALPGRAGPGNRNGVRSRKSNRQDAKSAKTGHGEELFSFSCPALALLASWWFVFSERTPHGPVFRSSHCSSAELDRR